MTPTDRELLEMAAKAAGITIAGAHERPDGVWLETSQGFWNPLHNDGDAFRLLLSTKLNLAQGDFSVCLDDEGTIEIAALVRSEDARSAATRRAIVRAAAAMAGEGE